MLELRVRRLFGGMNALAMVEEMLLQGRGHTSVALESLFDAESTSRVH